MPDISVQQPTFERLQRHAKDFIDTPDTVVARALDALEELNGEDTQGRQAGTHDERRLDLRALPSLTHTKVLDASINGQAIAKPNWNLLQYEMLRCAMKRVGSFEKVRRLCPVNMVQGRRTMKGTATCRILICPCRGRMRMEPAELRSPWRRGSEFRLRSDSCGG